MNYSMLNTSAEIRQFAASISGMQQIGFDSEFHWEGRYRPKPMLLQFATNEGVFLIDPLHPSGNQDAIAELFAVIVNQGIELVGHSLFSDLQIFYRITRALPAMIFDTQIAAALLGYGESVGLAPLLETTLKVSLNKRETASDWSKRPLSPRQLEYAANDVRNLLPLAGLLSKDLDRRGRRDWMIEECGTAYQLERIQETDPKHAWQRIGGRSKAGRSALPRLQSLAEERELIAQELDIPPMSVLHDELLVDLAIRNPSQVNEVENTGMRRRSSRLKKYAERWIKALDRSKQIKVDISKPPRHLRKEERDVMTLCRFLVTAIARRNEIAPSRLFGSMEPLLTDVIMSPAKNWDDFKSRMPVAHWKERVVLQELWDLLDGKVAITVKQGNNGVYADIDFNID